MDKTIKFIGGTLLLGLAAAVISAIVMGKSGKFDEMIEKIKEKKDFCERENDNLLKNGMCMFAKTEDEKKEINWNCNKEVLKTSPNENN